MRILRKPHALAMFLAWFLTVFLVAFPKGGFRLGAVPLTWGYLFLMVTAAPLLLVRLLALPLRMPGRGLVAVALVLPIQILLVYGFVVNGYENVAYTASAMTSLFLLPWLFLLVYPPFLLYIDGVRLSLYLRRCILFAALWGIFLFIWHPLTGKFIEIPYLTVNASDVGELELTKHISRGFFLKLISTYNNGNLYGVDTLILLPLYDLLEPIRWRRNIVKVALLLTLSRTVWAGMIVAELLSLSVVLSKQLGTFPVLHLGKASKRVGALAATVGLVFLSLIFNSNKIAFLLDPTLGGRAQSIDKFLNASFLPAITFRNFQEIAYAAAAEYFGYTGLAAFTLMLISPVLLLFVDSSALNSPVRRAALKGLILYTFLAGVDSGFNYIPTLSFYWFVYMIYIYGWPAAHAAVASRKPASPSQASPLPLSTTTA